MLVNHRTFPDGQPRENTTGEGCGNYQGKGTVISLSLDAGRSWRENIELVVDDTWTRYDCGYPTAELVDDGDTLLIAWYVNRDRVVKMTDSETYKLSEVAGAWCGGNRVVALVRDDHRRHGHPLVQLASRDNGETWSAPEPTNMPPEKQWGRAPQLVYDAQRELLIAMTSTRYAQPHDEQALYIYTARPGEIIDNPEGWTLQLEISRPWADDAIRDQRPLNHSFYGYPTIAPLSDDAYLVVFTERARMHGTEQADLYYFTFKLMQGEQ